MPAVISDYYKSIQGYFDWEHLYDEIAARLPEGGRFCEVGTWKGQSLAYLLTKLQELDKEVAVWGVDHFQGSVEDPKLRIWADRFDIKSICTENLDIIGYPYRLLSAASTNAVAQFPDSYFDCVFIDGSHDYASVLEDLRAWTPKVKSGGLLAGHDINQSDVRKALSEHFGESVKVEESPRPQELGGFRWGLCWKIER